MVSRACSYFELSLAPIIPFLIGRYDGFFFFAILKREALKFLPDADVGFYVPVSSNSRKTYKNSSIPVCKSGFNTQRISQQGEVILKNVTNLKGKEKTRESCNDFACQLF